MGTPEARRALVDEHMGLVRSLAAKARRSLSPTIELGDLVSLGTEGLLEAADRYDARTGHRFSTFAYYRIRGAIADGVRKMGWLPRAEYKRWKLQSSTDAYLEELAERDAAARLSPQPAPADRTDSAVKDVADALAGVAAIFVTSLDAHEETVGLLADAKSPSAAEQLIAKESHSRVHAALTKLPAKERRMLELCYFRDKTIKEAGEELGLSKSWACRLHAQAIDQLKYALARLEGEATARPRKRR